MADLTGKTKTPDRAVNGARPRPAARRTQQKPAAAPAKNGSGFFVMICLFFIAVGFIAYRQNSAANSAARQQLQADDPLMNPNSIEWFKNAPPPDWRNPNVSTKETLFCRGYQSANTCPDTPLHPFVEVFDFYGKQLEFPSEPDDRTITQEIELKGKFESAQ